MTYTDPGPPERGALAPAPRFGGRPRFVFDVTDTVVSWGLTSDRAKAIETSLGDFKTWMFIARPIRWPGPYLEGDRT